MTVDPTRKSHHAHHPSNTGAEAAEKKPPSSTERTQHEAARQKALLDAGSTSKLASQPTKQSNLMAQLRALNARYPEAGVNVALAAQAALKNPKLTAPQAFVRQALANKPALAMRLLKDFHLKHQSVAVRQLVQQGVAGESGSRLYNHGWQLISSLSRFSKQELGDIAGMVAAGESVDQAIANEAKELKRPVAYKAPASLKAQTRGPTAQARALVRSARALQKAASKTWSDLPHITRAAEAELGAVKAPTLIVETVTALADTLDERRLEPLKELGHEAQVTKDYLSGAVTTLQDRTRSAYSTLSNTLSSLVAAAEDFEAAMSKTPPDVLTAQKAQARANAASKLVEGQWGAFAALAAKLGAANKEFDHQVPHVVKEVLISAASFGLGLGLAAEGAEARHAASKAEKAVHFAQHAAQELATDYMLGKVVNKVGEGLEHIKRAVE